MNIEERLWNYIDGSCSADEQQAIGSMIASDEAVRLKYQQLLALNAEFAAIEPDEPPMAFTYNVMEAIRAEQAQKPLKAAINKRIILGIALFFAITITALLVYTFANIHVAPANINSTLPFSLKLPQAQNFLTRPVVNAFVFFDVVAALFFFDAWLRRKKKAGSLQ